VCFFSKKVRARPRILRYGYWGRDECWPEKNVRREDMVTLLEAAVKDGGSRRWPTEGPMLEAAMILHDMNILRQGEARCIAPHRRQMRRGIEVFEEEKAKKAK